MEKVVLVDRYDNQIGTEEKLQAHVDGRLHRALSVFVFNDAGEFLLQQRAASKYHCPGLWSNTCCSHPRLGEDTEDAAHRRLREEMGFDCPIEQVFSFIYSCEFPNGLKEHECDHVFIGRYNGAIKLNPEEVGAYKWMSKEAVDQAVRENKDSFTPWFVLSYGQVYTSFRDQ